MGYQDIPVTLGSSAAVTSVGLSLPNTFSVSGSPVTATGTLTGTFTNQSANTVLAGPQSGAAGTPSFRQLVPSDLGSSTGNCARYYASSSTISSTFGTVSFNNRSFDPSTGYFNGVYTIPAAGAGIYLVNSSLLIAATTLLNQTASIQLVQAGSVSQSSQETVFAGGAINDFNLNITDIFKCQPGDTITVLAASNATTPTIAASTSQNYFSITQIL